MTYEYGFEYPTNGVKPDLPGDVLVQVKDNGGSWVHHPARPAWEWNWVAVSAFRIVDERYKPSESSRHERGELPPVGTVIELGEDTEFLNLAGGKVTVIKAGAHCHVVGHAKRPDNDFTCVTLMSVINPNAGFCTGNHEFLTKPIRTEREKFIEAAGKVLNKPEINDNIDASFTLRQAVEALFDAGFKAPERN